MFSFLDETRREAPDPPQHITPMKHGVKLCDHVLGVESRHGPVEVPFDCSVEQVSANGSARGGLPKAQHVRERQENKARFGRRATRQQSQLQEHRNDWDERMGSEARILTVATFLLEETRFDGFFPPLTPRG